MLEEWRCSAARCLHRALSGVTSYLNLHLGVLWEEGAELRKSQGSAPCLVWVQRGVQDPVDDFGLVLLAHTGETGSSQMGG